MGRPPTRAITGAGGAEVVGLIWVGAGVDVDAPDWEAPPIGELGRAPPHGEAPPPAGAGLDDWAIESWTPRNIVSAKLAHTAIPDELLRAIRIRCRRPRTFAPRSNRARSRSRRRSRRPRMESAASTDGRRSTRAPWRARRRGP